MTKDWLHLPSLDRTIDLNVVSDIHWNKQGQHDKRFRTVIFLGTNLSVDRDYVNVYNEMSIFTEADRRRLYGKFPGIPIALLFDEVLNEAPPGEDATDKDTKDEDSISF